MPHMNSPAAEKLLDKEFLILDKGFIRLVDYMGGDSRIVDAARVSYQSGTKQVQTDEQLIRYLLRHKHTTPLEKVRFEFHVKLPIFVARQWMRHRMGSFNEMSARYSILEDEFYEPHEIRKQSLTNRQGSSEEFVARNVNENWALFVKEHDDRCYKMYKDLLTVNAAREQARMVLPVNIYTQFYWTVDLWNLMHFMKLRSDPHAQWEIQEYSRILEACVGAVCPIAYSAWCTYYRDAVMFSITERQTITNMLLEHKILIDLEPQAKEAGMTTRTPSGKLSREFKEFLTKLHVESPNE